MPRAKGKANYTIELLSYLKGPWVGRRLPPFSSCDLKSLPLMIMRMSRGIGLRNFVISLKKRQGTLVTQFVTVSYAAKGFMRET
jgi:hypothetical protein